jgi:hypothetical protein
MTSPGSASPFRSAASEWTSERISKLDRDEMEQLKANAERLGEDGVAALCDAALANCAKRRAAPAARSGPKRLISRRAAFEARGVYLQDARTSWGGVRKSDGAVVLALWADAVRSRDGGCAYLLWAPNKDGASPWSDTASGQERLKHCELVVAGAPVEGLLVFGESLAGHAPEHKARSVFGVDPETTVRFSVEKHDDEYWAVWGKRG